MKQGPLAGLRVVEFEAIGPAPFCGMMLADMGADVLLVERPPAQKPGEERKRRHEIMLRGRRSITLDLQSEAGLKLARELAARSDVVIQNFKVGGAEKGKAIIILTPADPPLIMRDTIFCSLPADYDQEKIIKSIGDALLINFTPEQRGIENFLQDRLDIHQKHGWMLRSLTKK